jgi:hypothetical protein
MGCNRPGFGRRPAFAPPLPNPLTAMTEGGSKSFFFFHEAVALCSLLYSQCPLCQWHSCANHQSSRPQASSLLELSYAFPACQATGPETAPKPRLPSSSSASDLEPPSRHLLDHCQGRVQLYDPCITSIRRSSGLSPSSITDRPPSPWSTLSGEPLPIPSPPVSRQESASVATPR